MDLIETGLNETYMRVHRFF